ncbi:hypothetical protein EPYR_00814 [Erwinia pyrifoliae DSM 12163]|nr:hypothetical protein EPYR_00814 [Erwinia pyrifoliae DSM 12163]
MIKFQPPQTEDFLIILLASMHIISLVMTLLLIQKE